MKIINVVFIVLVMISCNSNTPNNHINLEKAIRSNIDGELSDFADSIHYIPLKTPKESLLPGRLNIAYVNNQYIILNTSDYFYLFGIDGNFIRRIGNKGRSSKEYIKIYSSIVDINNQRLIYYVGNNLIQFWSFDGSFIKSIKYDIKQQIGGILLCNDDNIVCELKEFSDTGFNLNIAKLDNNGNILTSYPIYKDFSSINNDITYYPVIYLHKNKAMYKSQYSGYLSAFDYSGSSFVDFFNLGRFTPTRESIDNLKVKERSRDHIAQIMDIVESSRYYYIILTHGKFSKCVVIDKNSHDINFSKEFVAMNNDFGIYNNLSKFNSFWPRYIDDFDNMYSLIDPASLSENDMHSLLLKTPKCNITSNSNPLIIKVK